MRRIPFPIQLALFIAVSAILFPPRAAGQGLVRTENGELVERVVAVVGDSVVTLTELQEYLLTLRAQGQLPDDPAGMAVAEDEALAAIVDQLLIIQAAARDSTLIPEDEEIEGRVEQVLDQAVQTMGGMSAFQAALVAEGVTQAEYRTLLTQRIRREQIRQLFLQANLREAAPVAITEAEARAVFEERRVGLGERPELVTMRQAVVTPVPSDSAWAESRRIADSILVRALAGEDFPELARESSMDATSAVGGDLGWFRRGVLLREFEDTAFRLPPGEISDPVRTQYGWHIIKVERTRPGEVNARHILTRPESGAAADERARSTADEIARRVRSGEDMRALLAEFGTQLDAEIPDSVPVQRARMAQDLPPAYQGPLAGVREGDLVGPFAFPVRDQTAWVVVEVVQVRPAGEFTFEDLRQPIEAQLSERRSIDNLIQGLRERTYVDIRH